MKLITVASNTPFAKRIEQAQDRAKLRREVFEKPRAATSKRLQKDVAKIAKDEVEFSKRLLREIIPIEVSIDKQASGLKALIPLHIVFTNSNNTDNTDNTNNTDNKTTTESDDMSAYMDDEIKVQ